MRYQIMFNTRRTMNRLKFFLNRYLFSRTKSSRNSYSHIAGDVVKQSNPRSLFGTQHLVFSYGQSIGKQRDHNEDSIFSFSASINGDGINTSYGLFVVADGMGGHQHGQIASSSAARTFSGSVLNDIHHLIYRPLPDKDYQGIILSAMKEAHQFVVNTTPGGGTTLTAALVVGEQLIVGHVGDSRAYTLDSNGFLDVLTRDHSLVKRLVEIGQISIEEALSHPQRNVLYRAVGQDGVFEADIHTRDFPQGGSLLICSDGLWSVVSEKDIRKILLDSQNVHNACQELLTAANDAGGPDNISVILIQQL